MEPANNHYILLKLPRDATSEEIRKGYFDAARRYHPDTNKDQDANEVFLKIKQAYDVLSNPTNRAEYDQSLGLTEPVDPAVSVNVLYSRSVLPFVTEPQLIYTLLEVMTTAEQNQSEAIPLNLSLVIDRSTSMQGARMDMVKANAFSLIRQLRPVDIISVIAFSDRAEILIPATHNPDPGRVEAQISMLQARGGTEIYQGLKLAFEEIRKNLNPRSNNQIILLTDGRTYGDDQACLNLAEMAASFDIGISGLGIGHEWNDELLDKLASFTGGNSIYVSAPKDLHKFLVQKYTHLTQIYAENASLELSHEKGIELLYAFRLQPESGELPVKDTLPLGNIIFSNRMLILLEFLVKTSSSGANEIKIANGRLMMDIPSRVIPTARVLIKLGRPISTKLIHELPHPALLQAMARLNLYRMQEKARLEVGNKQYQKATQRLEKLAALLLEQGERELAHTVQLEAEHIQQTYHFSKEGDKRIKYGTRSLFLSTDSKAGEK